MPTSTLQQCTLLIPEIITIIKTLEVTTVHVLHDREVKIAKLDKTTLSEKKETFYSVANLSISNIYMRAKRSIDHSDRLLNAEYAGKGFNL